MILAPGKPCPHPGCTGTLRLFMPVPDKGPGVLDCSAHPTLSPEAHAALLDDDAPYPETHVYGWFGGASAKRAARGLSA